jgi:Cys-tRNA(Pro)/Cys-tRNA(Cys) deacylase
MPKTNAIRFLETNNIQHVIHEYDVSDGKIDGISVAYKIGRKSELVYKTLNSVDARLRNKLEP